MSPIVQIRKLRLREASEALKVTSLEGAELGFQARLIAKAGFFFLPFRRQSSVPSLSSLVALSSIPYFSDFPLSQSFSLSAYPWPVSFCLVVLLAFIVFSPPWKHSPNGS